MFLKALLHCANFLIKLSRDAQVKIARQVAGGVLHCATRPQQLATAIESCCNLLRKVELSSTSYNAARNKNVASCRGNMLHREILQQLSCVAAPRKLHSVTAAPLRPSWLALLILLIWFYESHPKTTLSRQRRHFQVHNPTQHRDVSMHSNSRIPGMQLALDRPFRNGVEFVLP